MSYKRTRAAFESDQQGTPHHAPFALYGTPLPGYESDARDDGSFVPVWKQTVTDERGRKRLHGAFTGGWSAGYFNTVGSKEGWTPSTFVSSRANRAKDQKDDKPREQRPEDFMDEEDLTEQAEAQELATQHAFAGLGSGSQDGGGRGMFADLFKTTGETMGIKLLERMGWKQGQGVGPRVRRRAKGDDKGELHLFAPENSRMVRFVRKLDRKGIGFAGEEKLDSRETAAATGGESNEDDSGEDARILRTNRSALLAKSKPRKKGVFGVGVLNDTGSDDEDPYSVGPRISYNRIIGGDRKKRKGGIMASNAVPAVIKPTSTSKKLAQRTTSIAGFRKCHDGRLPLEGFVLTNRPTNVLQENKYPPPPVPPGWSSEKQPSTSLATKAPYQSSAAAAKESALDPSSRAALLGEQQLPGKSVFDFLSPAARDRLAAASGKSNLPPGLGESLPAGSTTSAASQRRTMWDRVPTLAAATATAALQRGRSGWMPYAEDEGKRARYRAFLELSAGTRTALPERPPAFSVDEWSNELREFADAAEIFKPASGLMASRFTTSSVAPQRASDAPDGEEVSGRAELKTEDPAEKAARMGMFGPLTRSRLPFHPTRLLCKRFGVKPPANVGVDPSGDGESAPELRRLDVVSQTSLNRMIMEANLMKDSSTVSGGSDGATQTQAVPSARAPPAVVDVEKNDALEGEKAGEAVFKAIFGSDDEDD